MGRTGVGALGGQFLVSIPGVSFEKPFKKRGSGGKLLREPFLPAAAYLLPTEGHLDQ
jgi:hypothetical protein